MIIERPNFQRLAGDIAGQIILPEDADYEVARRVWNGMIDKRPLGIVRCANADDVLATIAFASDNGIEDIAVRGGGHNIAGNATCDRGLLIDLSPMKSIEVDPHNRRARAGGAGFSGASSMPRRRNWGLLRTAG